MVAMLEEVTKIVRTRLRKQFGFHPNFDDALQEGVIYAWRSMTEKGITDKVHLANRAFVQSKKFLVNPDQLTTGASQRSRAGYERPQSKESREKIHQFIEEYTHLHGKKPETREIAQAVGFHASHVLKLLNRDTWVNTGLDGGTSRNSFTEINFSVLLTSVDDDATYAAENVGWLTEEESFEQDVIGSLYFDHLLAKLPLEQARALALSLRFGWSDDEIARTLGYNHRASIRHIRLKGLAQLRKMLDD